MKFMMNMKKRLSEPSSWAGLAAVAYGVGELGKINEAPEIAETLQGVGAAVAGGADPMQAGLMGLFGLAAVFMREKKD